MSNNVFDDVIGGIVTASRFAFLLIVFKIDRASFKVVSGFLT